MMIYLVNNIIKYIIIFLRDFFYLCIRFLVVYSVVVSEKGYLEKDSIKKISPDFSVTKCKQLMDTENYTFNIESKYASEPEKIADTTTE